MIETRRLKGVVIFFFKRKSRVTVRITMIFARLKITANQTFSKYQIFIFPT